jgi:hypothetical protein
LLVAVIIIYTTISGNGKKCLKAHDGNILFNNCKKMIEEGHNAQEPRVYLCPFLAAFERYYQKLYSMRNDHF